MLLDSQRLIPCKSSQMWKPYDPDLVRLRPDRRRLMRPEPDMAFGVDDGVLSDNVQLVLALESWSTKSKPCVNLFVTPDMALPFLLFECKSSSGCQKMADEQLANAAIQAHDCLCSIDAQDKLCVFGVTVVNSTVSFYVIISARIALEQPCCDKVRSHMNEHVLMLNLDGIGGSMLARPLGRLPSLPEIRRVC